MQLIDLPDDLDGDNPFEIFDAVSDELDADVLYMNCGISGGLDTLLIKAVKKGKVRKNVLLILITNGGNPDVAFKIARCLQNNYEKFSIFIPGWCKSAGTLIAVGAHTIYFSDHGELGPLDIQMGKKDELDGYVSGLDLDYGIRNLGVSAFSMFEHFMPQTIRKSNNRVTFKTSAEIAASLTQAYISKFTEQVSPLSVGETVRMMTIAREYGERLDGKYENVASEMALVQLVSGYSSHSFVIDFQEASGLFKRVEWATPALQRLEKVIGTDFLFPFEGTGQDELLTYLRGSENDDDTSEGQRSHTEDGDGQLEDDTEEDNVDTADISGEDVLATPRAESADTSSVDEAT
ncbi:MAG: SDH family Clp fold serine proteinase [Janthinobacterium lividum]